MRQLILGLCIFTTACSNQGGLIPPTAPSGVNEVTGAQAQATRGANIDVTFTKWVDPNLGFPYFKGIAAVDDVPVDFAATVLDRTVFDNGNIVDLRAIYEVITGDPASSFMVEIEGKQNNQTQSAVLNGSVVSEGPLKGARVHVTFDVIRPCQLFDTSVCFTGILRVLAGSAD